MEQVFKEMQKSVDALKPETQDHSTSTLVDYFKDQTLAGVVVDKAQNRFNIYLGGGLGFEVNNQIQVILGYNHSLMNIMNDDDHKAGRGQITVGLGYKF
jgi:opacity protein-like surface antigen